MVLPRPTPPQRYSPRSGVRAVGAGNQGRRLRSLSPMERDDFRRAALRRSSRTPAPNCAGSNSSRPAAISTLRRDSTVWIGLDTMDAMILETLVVGTGTALRRHPGDLSRVGFFDVAGLAMHAVGGVDLQFGPAAAVHNHFVDVRRAKI